MLNAKGGQPGGADGQIRFEAVRNAYSGDLSGTPVAYGRPHGLFLPPDPSPSVRLVSIDGVPLNTYDFGRSAAKPVTLMIEARFVPPGSPIEMEFFGERGAKQAITSTPLEGTLQLSRATAQITFHGRNSVRLLVRAKWSR